MYQRFPNVASDWLAAVLPANGKPRLKIPAYQHGFNMKLFVTQAANQ